MSKVSIVVVFQPQRSAAICPSEGQTKPEAIPQLSSYHRLYVKVHYSTNCNPQGLVILHTIVLSLMHVSKGLCPVEMQLIQIRLEKDNTYLSLSHRLHSKALFYM